MPPKKNKVPKKIEISEDLLINGDDSSDGEDYEDTDSELEEDIEDFILGNEDIDTEVSKVSYILEDRGRKVLYSSGSRSDYKKYKKEVLKYSEEDFSKININVIKDAIVESLIKGCGSEIDEDIATSAAKKVAQDIVSKYEDTESDLIRLLLRQSNTEFVLPKFQEIIDYFQAALVEEYFPKKKEDINKNHQLFDEAVKQFADRIKPLNELEVIDLAIYKKMNTTWSLYKYVDGGDDGVNTKNSRKPLIIQSLNSGKNTQIFKNFKEMVSESIEIDSMSVIQSLNQSFNDKLKRRILKKTYQNNADIENPSDLYGKEHLIYRSVTRQSRDGEQEVSRDVIFNDDEDLTVQKWQSIKSQSAASDKHVKYRGTLQEEVYNLGNYLSVLRKIKSFGQSDKTIAGIIRDVYRIGIQEALELWQKGSTPLSQIYTQQQKQTLVELVELFFGTEAFRSPSTIIETNMALDLIIAEELSWEDALTKTEGLLEKIKNALEDCYSNKDLVMMINGTKQTKDDVRDLIDELKIIFYPEGIDKEEQDQSNERLNLVIYGQSKLKQNETEDKRQERIEKKFKDQLKKKKDIWDEDPEEYQDKIDEFNKSQLNRWRSALEKQKQVIGGGGALSFTMKSSEDAGGIEAGRRLSEDANLTHSRKHKYGGKPIDKETEGYKEYLSRKKGIVEKWLELEDVIEKWGEIQDDILQEEDEDKPKSSISKAKAKQVEQPSPKTAISNPLLLKKLIDKKEQEWYK